MKKFYQLFLTFLFVFLAKASIAAVTDVVIVVERNTCPGVCDGKAYFTSFTTTPGSTGPYIFNWIAPPTPTQTGDTAFNLCSGSHVLQVLDLSDPTPANTAYSEPFIVPLIGALFVNPFITQESCFNSCDGSITAIPGGGTTASGTYSYQWDHMGSTSQTISSLCQGNYSVTVTDDNGCTTSSTFMLGGPSQIQPMVTANDIDCNGNANGSGVAAPMGGVPPYTYSWSSTPGNNSTTENGLSQGMYTVTVTDDDGCTGTETFTINEPAAISITVTPDNVDCFGESTGSAMATVNGGTVPYTYDWGGGNTSDDFVMGLAANNYIVTVTDANGCTETEPFTINENTEILIDLDSTDVDCNGNSTGIVMHTISGGTPPYNWVWSSGTTNTGSTGQSINLSAGTYTITVTDALNCEKIDSIVVNQPTVLEVSINSIMDPSCVGGADGEIDISITGGTPPYVTLWNDLSPDVDRMGLAAGTYTVQVTDNNGCQASADTVLVNPAPILANVDTTDVSCRGGNDGTATATPTGGSGTYVTFQWSSNLANNTPTETGLAAGTYTVTITDSDGCTGSETFVVNEPATLFTLSTSDTDADCFGNSTGSVTATVSGGDPMYTFLWDDMNSSTTATVTGLPAGTYNVTATDANGCQLTGSATVDEPNSIVIGLDSTDVGCNSESTGSITINISGGSPIYSWTLAGSSTTSGMGNQTVASLAAGLYRITVTDANNCSAIDSIVINEPPALMVMVTREENPLCTGDANGEIDISASGGTIPYTFEWSDMSPSQNRNGLAANTYTVTVTDNNGCTVEATSTLTDPPMLTAIIDSLEDVSCNGFSDGFLRVLASGGTGAYTYGWSGPGVGPTTAENPNLPAGTYTVTVSDNNGCQLVIDTTILEPIALVAGATSMDASCSGAADGTATASEVGGTAPYSWEWSTTPTQTSQTATGLVANTYTVTVTDANGCTDTETVVVDEPTTISLSTTQNNADCNGAATGDATVIPTGGTPPLSFEWSTVPPQFTATAINLAANTYTVTVTDNNGCNTTAMVTITEPTAVTATITAFMNPTCNGIDDGTITAGGSGGTAPLGYSYAWSTTPTQTTQTISGLGAGTYTVTVSDDNGCTDVTSQTLAAPPSVIVTESINNVACNGDNTGNIKLTTTGGTPPYTYNWNPLSTMTNASGDSAFNLSAGTYTATILDNNGCFIVNPYNVTEPATGLVATFDTIDVSCNGLSDGSAKVTVTGGTMPYLYDWEGSPSGDLTDSIFNLAAGTYRVTITDDGGCTLVDSTSINEPNAITIVIDTTINVACNGEATGGATVTASGGNGTFNYVWSFMGTTGPSIANLTAGTYTVTATDGNNCTATLDIPISEPDTLRPVLRTQDVSCGGTNDAFAVVDVTGGAGGYGFVWDPVGVSGQFTDSIFDLTVGNYSVTVTDANNCDSIINFTIDGATSNFTFRDSLVNDSCGGGCNGYIEILDLAGGNAPYSFEWSRAMETTPSLSNVCVGTYTVTITDNSGCDSTATFMITEPNAISATVATVPDTCIAGVGSASINGSVSGGTMPFTFDWGNGPTSDDFVNNLSATNYNLTISDANGCETIIPFTIGNVAPFSISFITSDVSCNGLMDGTLQVSTIGATNPVTYNWEDGLTGGANPPPVGAGVYEITVTDANGCAAIDTAIISEPDAIGTTIMTVSESCFPGTDGSAVATSTGGVAPLTYDWGNGPTPDNFVNNRVSGFYRVTITDANNCQEIEPYNIGDAPPFISTINTTDASCNGGNDGIIDISLSGGVAPFTFDWPIGSGLVGQMPTNASQGVYSVTITDATGCTVVRAANVGEANPIDVVIDTLQDESCSPGTDGFAKISASGGTDPYTFDWDPSILPGNISADGDSVFNLAMGPYNVTVTDGIGCTRISSIFINQGSDIFVATNVTDPLCFGDMNGTITLNNITGGTPPYSIEWFDMSTGMGVTGLGVGAYAVTITDNATPPCTKVELIPVGTPDPITVDDFGTTLESCNPGADGTATILASGGTAPLSFAFSGGMVGASPNIVEGLVAGTYTVTVSDVRGCQRAESFTIQAAQNFTLDIDSIDATCGGGADGELFTTITGGVNPYSYNWDGGSLSGADPKNLMAGTYTLTVTDAFGCTATGQGTVNEPLAIMANFTITDESCFPGMDGSIIATPVNGQGNYTYDWGNGPTSDNFANNLVMGTFDVTITDDSMCVAILPYTIGSSAPFTLTDSIINIDCAGNMTGEIYLTSTNLAGPLPETYQWSSNVGANTTAQNQTNLAAGTYSVTVTDPNNGCFETEMYTLTEPDTLRATAVITNAGCQPVADDGAIDVTITGGTPPFTYMWSNGPMTQDIANLLMGSYTVTVIDSNACQAIETFVVGNQPQITIDLDSIDVSCSGAMDGSASVVASSGVTPYTYEWSNMGTTPNITGLSGGTYSVTVTDNAACSIIDSIVVNETIIITTMLDVTPENCIPGNDGTATATPSGGTPPYTYDWGNGSTLVPVETGLSANTYTVTITDNVGCFITETFIINSAAPFMVDTSFTNNVCAGDSTGTITITVTGNVGPVTYDWPNPLPNTSTQMGLGAGTYTVTITDIANGCTETVPFTITEPDSIKPMATISPENCNPGGNGSIIIAPTGGDGNYSFNWFGPSVVNPANQDQFNLSQGRYFLTITDGNSCLGIDSFDVQSIISTIPNLTVVDDGCSPLAICLGSAKVDPTGGVAPYTYEWEGPGGPIASTMDSIGSLCAGSYTLTLTDNSGCDTILNFDIQSGRTVFPNEIVIDESCDVDDSGEISVTPSGGDAPYTYEWAGSPITDSLRTGLSPGSYTVTITDISGCDTSITVVVGTEQFDYSVSSTNITCSGTCDGTAGVSLAGGSAGFTFAWSNMENTQNISGLCDGKYFVTITNTANGCTREDSVVVDPTTIILPNESFTNETCFSFCDGTIDLAPTGGAGGYSYAWTPSSLSGPNLTGLCGGMYTVTITDANNCDTSLTFDIQSSPLILATVSTRDLSCGNSGSCDGRAFVTASNGVPPYVYDWPIGVSTVVGAPDTAINLCAGTYTVTISDAGSCSITETFVINGPAPIAATFTIDNSTCNIPNGELSVVASGGSGTYTYEWFDAMSNPIGTGTSIIGLASGAYSVLITDDAGCSESFNASVDDDGAETITISSFTDVSCFGDSTGSATVSFTCTDPAPTAPGCTVEWFDNATGTSLGVSTNTINGLPVGTYYVEVINNSGCKATEFVTISEPSEIQVSESITDNVCGGAANGAISLSVSGGAGNFSFNWSPAPGSGQNTNSVSGLSAGTYTVTITDDNSCDTILSYTIGEPLIISATFTTSSANCNMADGTINATVAGGTVVADYEYQWFDGANTLLVGETNPVLMNVSAGNYALRVRDDNVCQEIFNITLDNANGPTVVVDSTKAAGCFGESNGAIYTRATGANPPFTYNWLPTGQTTKDIFNLAEGTYTLQVTDALGCITSVIDSVKNSSELMANISIQEATCGICNGIATISVTGGTSPYSYLWSDGSTTDSADSLCGGNYTVVVTDAAGCSKSFDFGVNTIGGPTGETVSITPASCANTNDGTATVVPIGGTPPYTYVWQHNTANTNSLNNLGVGKYFLQVADARSCSRTVEIDITGPPPIVVNPVIVGSTCNMSDGSILLNVSGGVAPYTYNWTHTAQDTNFLNNLSASIYNVNVLDANGCIENLTITLNNTGSPVAVQPTITDVSCYGFCDGALSVRNELTGVGTTVDFQWLDSQNTPIKGVNLDTEPTDLICAGTYVLELTSIPEGCKSFIPVVVSEPDSITLSSSIVKNISCAGSCDGEIFINTRGGNILYTYSWNDPSIPDAIPAMGLCADTYTVTATDANGCEATTSVRLEDPPVLTVSITSNTDLICSSDCNASATTVGSGGVAPYTFTWSGGQTGPNPNNLCFEENTVTLTDARGCSVTDVVNIGAIDTVKVESFGNPVVCDGDSIRLNGQITGSSISSFGWYESDGVTLFTTTLDTTFAAPVGNYTYILIATSGSCSDMEPFDVTVFANPVVGLPSLISLFNEEVSTIEITNEDIKYTYLWSPSDGLNDSSMAEPVTSIREDITYTLLVTDTTTGCTYLDSVPVTYAPNIEIPTGITPNGDGVNDVWNIEYLNEFPKASVQIFNRWGKLLFESTNGYNNPWDGTYEGKALPIGTYYYIIDLNDPKVSPLTGPITIVR